MSGVQMILVIGVLGLFSSTCLMFNGNQLQSMSAIHQTDSIITAVVLGQSIIEQAKSLKFDEQIGAYPPSSFPPYFTSGLQLGPDAGDTVRDDIDDYNGYNDVQEVDGRQYTLTAEVQYLNDELQFTAARTYYKLLQVTVASAELPAALTLHYVVAYKQLTNCDS